MNACAICKSTQNLYHLEVPIDDDDAEAFWVCGSCWEVIAEIANRRTTKKMETMQAQIDALLDAVPSAKVRA
jgi:hypothetical protein